MLRLVIDQDFDHDIVRGLRRRTAEYDAISAYEAGVGALDDPDLLAWAAGTGRIVVTHDRKTMPRHAADVLAANGEMAGVLVVPRSLSIAQAIAELELIVLCSEQHEWAGLIQILPL